MSVSEYQVQYYVVDGLLDKVKFQLIGQKALVVAEQNAGKLSFVPFCNNQNEIEGTQVMMNNKVVHIFKNKNQRWNQQTEIVKAGYEYFKNSQGKFVKC